MSEYPKIIELPYKVYTGEPEFVKNFDGSLYETGIHWTYQRSFQTESETNRYVQRASGFHELVKIEKKETE